MHKRVKYIYAILIVTVMTANSYGQQPVVPQVKPISPAAAALFKVLERPVGSSSGTIPVSFPLLSVGRGSLSVPITLSYGGTGGIKVEEVASEVGLGFSLSVGGRITRIQNGISDDLVDRGRLRSPLKPSNFNISDPSHLLSLHLNQFDQAPDVFMYSVNGKIGKFILKETGEVLMLQKTDIKIEYVMGAAGIDRWLLVDGEGNKYDFTIKESTEHTYVSTNGGAPIIGEGYVSSWLMTKMSDMNDENAIDFIYEGGGSSFTTFSGGFLKMQVFNTFGCPASNSDEVTVSTLLYGRNLKKITGDFGYVDFVWSSARLDANGWKVQSISLYDNNDGLKKSYKFNYDYFISSYTYGGIPEEYRLKLKSFSEFGGASTDSLTYRFTYEEYINLPKRLSKAVDFWGYYNGQIDNWTYFPNISSSYYGVPLVLSNLSNRNPYPEFAQANILKRISYPTGGYREIFYEGNTALKMHGDQIPEQNSSVNRTFSRNDFQVVSPSDPNLQHYFEINTAEAYTTFSFNLSMACMGSFRIEIYSISPGQGYGGNLVFSEYNFLNSSLQLSNGNYRVDIYTYGGCEQYNSFEANWQEQFVENPQSVQTPYGSFLALNKNVGGVRVKKVSDTDPVSSKTYSTDYLYKMYSTDENLTSGLLITPVRMINEYNNPECTECRFMMLFPQSCYPLAAEGGSYVMYPEVRTIESGNGWTDHKYSIVLQGLPADNTYPIAPLVDNNTQLRGQLLLEKVYSQIGTLLKEKSFQYGQVNTQSSAVKGMSVRLSYYDSSVGCVDQPIGYPKRGTKTDYEYNDLIMDLLSEQEILYGQSANLASQTTYDYYSFLNNAFLKQAKTVLSDGATKETNFRYPFSAIGDFQFPLTASEITNKDALVILNYQQPIEIANTVSKAGVARLVGGSKYLFGVFANNKVHLSRLKEYSSPSEYRETVFSAYGDKGNIREKYRINGPKEVYLWSYNNQYPIAEIRNSDYITVENLLGGSTAVNSFATSTPSGGQINAFVDMLRNAPQLKNAQITSYTYRPLVGMASRTDVKGMTIYYEHDDHLRLSTIKDQNGNIVKSFSYNYKQP